MLVLLLWHRGCLSDITGALFCCPGTISGWFPGGFTFCFWVLLQTAFLHVFVKTDILQLGAYDHSVRYATAQLTEGRSARDQPKQPPAKKKDRKGSQASPEEKKRGRDGNRSTPGWLSLPVP